MVDRGADFEDCVVVELEGDVSEDEDFDADEGALLVLPTRILDVRPVDKRQVTRARGV
jgi:uncharacterized protein YbcI